MFIHRDDPQYQALKALAERSDRSNVPSILQHMGSDNRAPVDQVENTTMPHVSSSSSSVLGLSSPSEGTGLETAFGDMQIDPSRKAPIIAPVTVNEPTETTTPSHPLPSEKAAVDSVDNSKWAVGSSTISEADRKSAASALWGAPSSPLARSTTAMAPVPLFTSLSLGESLQGVQSLSV